MGVVVGLIANLMFSKPGMPDREFRAEFLPNVVRRAPFDEPHSLLQGRRITWRQNQVKMVRHYYVAMEYIKMLFPVFEKLLSTISANAAFRNSARLCQVFVVTK